MDGLHRISRTVAHAADPFAALVSVAEETAQLFEAQLVAVLLLGEGVEGGHLAVSVPDFRPEAERLFSGQLRDPGGWLESLRRRDFSLVIENSGADALPEEWAARLGAEECARLMVVPLVERSSILGGLVVIRSRSAHPFDQADTWLAETIATTLALSVGVALRAHELDHFFAASLELLCMIDFTGHLHRLNPQWDQMLGYHPQELEGVPFLDLVHPEDRAATSAAFADLRDTGAPVQFVSRFRASDGSYRSMEWFARPGVDMIYASARDITLRLAQEQALRESETRFEDLVLTTGDWIWEVDAEGHYTAAGGKVEEVIGYAPQEVIGRTPFDFMSPEEAQRIVPIFTRMVERREGCAALVNRNQHKDGHEVVLLTACVPIYDSSGEFAGFRGVDKDVTLREKLGRALQESEDRYRLIAENTSDVIAVLDIDRMALDYVSPSVERLTGFTPDELIGRDLAVMLPPDARERAQLSTDYHRTASEGGDADAGYYMLETEFLRKDGGSVPVELSVRVLTDEQGKARKHVSLCRDISTRKEAERALRESEERYRLIAGNVADVIWVYDLASSLFTYISPSVERLRGYTPEEALNQSIQQAVAPSSYPKVAATLEAGLVRALAGEYAFVEGLEIEQPCKDGRVIDTEIVTKLLPGPDGKPAQLLGVSRDITSRKAAEEALRESRKRLEDLMFVVGDWIWEADAKFRYTQCSDGVRSVLGYEPAEVIGKTPWDFMVPEDGEQIREYTSRRIAAKEGCSEVVNRNLHKDGREVILLTSCVPILDDAGELLGFRGIDKDITTATQTQESLRRSVVELNALWQIAETVAGPQDLTAALNSVTRQVCDALEARSALVITFGEGGEGRQIVASSSADTAWYEGFFLERSEVHMPGLARLAASGEPLVINDVFAGPLPRQMAEKVGAHGFSRLLIIPLVLQTQTIGALIVTRSADGLAFRERDIEFAQAAAGSVAAAVVHTRLRVEENLKTANQVRDHLARELHDAVTQSVYSASLIAQALPTIWQRSPEEGMHGLSQLQRLVRSALAELRILLYELRPGTLAGVGLDQLLDRLGDSLAGQADVSVTIDAQIEEPPPPEVKEALYRIAQEAFNNIAKHARAANVVATAVCDRSGALLEVADDGVGVDVDAVEGDHMGLAIMRERAEEIGAQFTISGMSPAGTRLSVRWVAPEEILAD